jgi:hypothetical protein
MAELGAGGELSPKKSGNEWQVLGEQQSRPEKDQKKPETEARAIKIKNSHVSTYLKASTLRLRHIRLSEAKNKCGRVSAALLWPATRLQRSILFVN